MPPREVVATIRCARCQRPLLVTCACEEASVSGTRGFFHVDCPACRHAMAAVALPGDRIVVVNVIEDDADWPPP